MNSICVPGLLQLNQVVGGGGGIIGVHNKRRLRPVPSGCSSGSNRAAAILTPSHSAVSFPFPRTCRVSKKTIKKSDLATAGVGDSWWPKSNYCRQTYSLYGYELTTRWKMMQRIFTIFASNSSPSGGDSVKDKSEKITTKDAAQGPPFLTILAGLLVFLLVCWVFGSTILWLYGLIVNVPPSK